MHGPEVIGTLVLVVVLVAGLLALARVAVAVLRLVARAAVAALLIAGVVYFHQPLEGLLKRAQEAVVTLSDRPLHR